MCKRSRGLGFGIIEENSNQVLLKGIETKKLVPLELLVNLDDINELAQLINSLKGSYSLAIIDVDKKLMLEIDSGTIKFADPDLLSEGLIDRMNYYKDNPDQIIKDVDYAYCFNNSFNSNSSDASLDTLVMHIESIFVSRGDLEGYKDVIYTAADHLNVNLRDRDLIKNFNELEDQQNVIFEKQGISLIIDILMRSDNQVYRDILEKAMLLSHLARLHYSYAIKTELPSYLIEELSDIKHYHLSEANKYYSSKRVTSIRFLN